MTFSGSFRSKALAVCLATSIFIVLAVLFGAIIDVPIDQAVLISGMGGFAIGAVEEFYVQARAGRWLRTMHPLKSILIYGAVVCVIFFAVIYLGHLFLGRLDRLPDAYARLPITIPMAFGISLFGILVLRVIGFIGLRTLFYLLIGKYHRPVIEKKVFLFLDIRDSTAMVEALGAIKVKALIGKFLFDISKPITDHGGEIYLYTGDGLIAMWDWGKAKVRDNLVGAVDAIYAAVDGEKAEYLDIFERVPEFRIGVHGGDVVISEQGDTKRAIGVYGATINIAARLEQAAKTLGESCLFSADIVAHFGANKDRFDFIGEEAVKGISAPVGMYKFRAAV